MASPKHKIFFGIQKPGPSTAKPGAPPKAPCWTWDSEATKFSSELLGFDCDFDTNTLSSKTVFSSGFTWDQEDLTFDNEIEIFY